MGRPAGSGRRAPLPVVPKPSNMRHLLILLASSATGQVVIHNRLAGGPGHLSLGGPPPPPQDPCFPNPCGPGALCHPNPQGNAICTCQPGLIPKPDTITGCGPECVRDPDCQRGLVCRDQRCVEKPDPCLPSPCGPGAVCSPGQATPSADASLVSFPTQTPSPAASQSALGILTAREVTSARTSVVWSSPILATRPLVVQVPGAQSPGPATPSAGANQV